jgi:alkylation response protein AidB-like acyl-CoA dehydrogenase
MVMTARSTDLLELRNLCTRFLDDRQPLSLLDAAVDARRGLWDELVAMGWAATLIPESAGGLGWGWKEAAVLAVELGRTLAPVPFLSNALVAASGLRAVNEPVASATAAAVADGELRVTVAGLPSQGAGTDDVDITQASGRAAVRGACPFVLDAAEADRFIVAGRHGESRILVIVEVGPQVTVRPHALFDISRTSAAVSFEDAAATVIAEGAEAEAALAAMETALAMGLACDSLGGAKHVHEETVKYARNRVQFGRAIGSFQAIKHRLADLYVLLQGSTAIVDAAVAHLAHPDEEPVSMPSSIGNLAHAYASDAYARTAGDAVLVHGAIGFTWEHDLHRYLKRALLNQHLAGTTTTHRDRHLSAKLARLGGQH